ncbi:hypothetical protein [Nannocystis bainbridge]|uniref:Uncharacterized protein n=1 Tax=Nannocystis bainbridge TaxID=2995303 RepID=A0ABT5E8T6_9BACT|nr:hypothetical protein [Nannocystis bainbridge]MDC0721247.1 hypothetical protein [Nannocystis bainbridge]
MWDTPEAEELKQGQRTTLDIRGIAVRFPSERFCSRLVDDNFLEHVDDIVNRGTGWYGNGAVVVGSTRNCGHKKLTGGDAIGFKWEGDATLDVVGYGEKSSKGKKSQGSGGYSWET